MKIYRITRHEGDEAPYCERSLTLAHENAKDRYRGFPEARIELLNIKTDLESVIEMLNYGSKSGAWIQEGPLRTWRLTDRGGIKEIDNGT
jgi:hypothetical protein